MNTQEQVLTHKGWFGLCPVYIGDIYSEGPFLEPRHWSVGWLLPLGAAIYQGLMYVMDLVGAEPVGFPIRVTGQLAEPRVIQVELESAA